MHISVCICTFRRPHLLAELLAALGSQSVVQTGCTLDIVVIDNDPAHSARDVLTGWCPPEGCTLQFAHVPEPNISIARNAAVSRARGEWVAFIDDDETPQPLWLRQMQQTQQQFQADVVFGPVVPRYLPDTPAWIVEGHYFDRARYPTGTAVPISHARTGNVLLRAACFQAFKAGPFEISFGRTGGEDSLFFRALLSRGCKFVWCDEAAVSEEVPLARARAGWLLSRSYRVGQTWIRGELFGHSAAGRWAWGALFGARAFAQLFISLLLAVAWALLSRHKAFYWLRTAFTQAGKLTGMTGLRYKEYGA